MASSSSGREAWKYDVFLSFRGKDTRNSFTSHLYKELCQKGIITFKDDRELTKGEPLPLELPLAIDQSRILLIIFSKNYASSTWCLEELFQISKCKEAGGRQIVLPIFYDVTPSDVRYQTGDFGAAFSKHEDNSDKVQQWRIAAKQIADLSGWELKDRDESDFIEEIVRCIIREVRSTLSHSIAKDFVGMESRLQNMFWYLDLGQSDKVKIIGICGMGGIGKTTIASVVYKEISDKFEGHCFLEDVRETSEKHDLAYLQNKLLSATLIERYIDVHDRHSGADQIRHRLSRKKVLVILDDVSKLDQIEFLIGRRGETWFGPGSRIIITTRDEHILIQREVDKIYSVKELNYDEALQLFRSKAIQSNCNVEPLELCSQVVKYAGGLPLALTVLGSTLYGRSVGEWKGMLDRLKDIPNEQILSKLQISFDGLEEIQKKLFLDIACFFNGHEEDFVITILNSCGMFPECGITELKEKSLITVSYGVLKMHDLLQEMGRQIVLKESHEPGQRSRIWLQDHFLHVIMNDTGTEQTEGVVLNENEPVDRQDKNLSAKAFSQMKKLRLLILRNLQFSQDIMYLSNELVYLNWYGCPFKYFPPAFLPNKLVELHLQRSCIEYLWDNIKEPRLKWLKVIDLSYSENLIKTPDFTEMSNLEKLNFEGCLRLHEVHRSIGVLQKLVSLNLRLCGSLVSLPSGLWELKSLKILNLDGCTKLSELPHKSVDLESLEELHMAGIGTQKALSSLLLSWLTPWKNQNRYPLASLLHSLTACSNLRELDLSNCNLLDGAIPSDLSGKIPMVEILNLSGNNFEIIPLTLNQLSRLQKFRIANCKMLKSLPDLPSSIQSLVMENCTSLEVLPNFLEKSNDYTFWLYLHNCTKLKDYQDEFTVLKNCLLCSFRFWQNDEIMGFRDIYFPGFELALPGTEIPSWFNYQGVGSTLRVELPYENYSRIFGIVVCILFKREAVSQLPENGYYMTLFGGTDWHYLSSSISPAATDHLYMTFCESKMDMEEVCYAYREKEVLLTCKGEGIKKLGMRVLHDRDMEELIQSGGSLFSGSQNMNQTKRSREQDCSNSYSSQKEIVPLSGLRIVLEEDHQKMHPFSISVANPEAGCSAIAIEDLPPLCPMELKDEGD